VAKEAYVKLIASLIGLFWLAISAGAVVAVAMKRQLVPREDEDADEVAIVAIFGPMAFHSRATAFRGGTVDCWYGGGVVDLRDATLDPAGATLTVRAIFGGGQILVPDGWQVESAVSGIGALRDMRASSARTPDAPRLIIEGLVLFGGFGVTADIPEDALKQLTSAVAKQRGSNGSSPAEAEPETSPAI
jgi:hypothetical protein